jgi:hypothetical protein
MERVASKQCDGIMGAAQHVMRRIPVSTDDATPLLSKEQIILWSRGRAHSLRADFVSQEFTASRNVHAIPVNKELTVSSHLVQGVTPHHAIDEVFVYGGTRLHVQSHGRSHSLRVAIVREPS